MQIKKEKIKANIDRAALKVFGKKGFEGSSMAEIADLAGVSVGNIYRYYSNKEKLFYELIPQDFVKNARDGLVEKIRTLHGLSLTSAKSPNQPDFLNLVTVSRRQLVIAFRYSKGTVYEKLEAETNADVLNLATETLKILKKKKNPEISNKKKRVIPIIYSNLLRGTLEILEQEIPFEVTQKSLDLFYRYHFTGLKAFQKK